MAHGAVVAPITLRGVPVVIEDRTRDGAQDPQDTHSELVLR